MEFRVLDIYRYAGRSDPDHRKLVELLETESPGDGIRIFHINGDEVAAVIQAFEARGGDFAGGYNIIVPAWELPAYPIVWAEQIQKFNEVWSLSCFIAESLKAVGIFSTHIGQPVEVPLGHFLPRKYFGIRESAFAILHFFDLSSYASRKNPDAVLAMFETIKRRRKFDDIQLILKVKRGDEDAEQWLQPLRDRLPEAHFLSKPQSALETRSLINACDCFVSLHRAEGFGRAPGEAMYVGRLALATGWSGNLDYMTKENSLLVDYKLVPVAAGEYPFGEGQVWADADPDHAAALLEDVIDHPDKARAIAANGRRDIRLEHSYRAVGLRVLDRVRNINAMQRKAVTSERGQAERKTAAEQVFSKSDAAPSYRKDRTALVPKRTLAARGDTRAGETAQITSKIRKKAVNGTE